MLRLVIILSVLSALAGVVGLGLSAFAADDMSRSTEAHRLQLLMVAWIAVSIAAPVLAWMTTLRSDGESPGVLGWLVPVILIAGLAIVRLLRF